MTVAEHHTVLPPGTESDEGRDLKELARVLSSSHSLTVTNGVDSIVLPSAVAALLREAVAALAAGRAVTVEPQRTVLTTQQAADLLSISRPTLVRLLTSGQIPFTTPGRHRRVRLADVLAFQQQIGSRRATALEQMSREDADGSDDTAGFLETR